MGLRNLLKKLSKIKCLNYAYIILWIYYNNKITTRLISRVLTPNRIDLAGNVHG